MTDFQPKWLEQIPDENSFRSIFKWGAKEQFKNPSQGFFQVIKNGLNLSDEDFKAPKDVGDTNVNTNIKSQMELKDIKKFESIVGIDNIFFDTYSRLKYSTGKSMEDIIKLRECRIEDISDIVLHPRTKQEIEEIVSICHGQKIPIHAYGGGSSVTHGLDCPKGGVTLVLSTHINKLIAFNEINQTITVEAGMMGPVYETLLNNAPKELNTKHKYTGGHFPQSFEFSSVGGWVVTLGSGQASSFYGDAYDLVISQEYITPTGSFKTQDFPATATGPKINDIMKGSEGCFGVLVAVTMKIFRFQPESAKPFTFMFPSFDDAVTAAREISQSNFGMPAILRISDPEETDIAMNMYGLAKGILDKFLNAKGLKPGNRCLLMGQTEGEPGYCKYLHKSIKKISKKNHGLYLTGYPMKKWRHGRFSDPYMRDALNDYGVLIDTLETSVTWENLPQLYIQVREYIKQHPNIILMTHASHFYAQGTNLYFIFIVKSCPLDEYRTFQQSIIEKIAQNHGSLSHHHGVGRMMGPWMEDHIGTSQMDVLRALKTHFDPNHIMNPGGLGL